MRRLAIAGALALLGALGLAEGSQACSCASPDPVEAMRQADAAIVGRLVEVVPRNRLQADYRYRVRRVFRGGGAIERRATISVRSNREAAACALPGRVGDRYGLFLARDEEDRWTAGICSVIDPGRLWRAARHADRAAGSSAASGANCAS